MKKTQTWLEKELKNCFSTEILRVEKLKAKLKTTQEILSEMDYLRENYPKAMHELTKRIVGD